MIIAEPYSEEKEIYYISKTIKEYNSLNQDKNQNDNPLYLAQKFKRQ